MFETSGSSACLKDKKIILASGSPRRIEMMRTRGIEPLVMPADIEENLPKDGVTASEASQGNVLR